VYVKVRYLGLVYRVTGVFEEVIQLDDGATIHILFRIILDRYEGLSGLLFRGDGSLNPLYRVTVNGRDIEHLEGFDTKLSNGDVVAFIGPAGG